MLAVLLYYCFIQEDGSYNVLSLQPVWLHRLSVVALDSSSCDNYLYVLSHGITTLK